MTDYSASFADAQQVFSSPAMGHNGGPSLEEFDKTEAAREFWGFIDRVRSSDLPAPARHVAIEIWLHMRLGKLWSEPSVARLAKNTGLSERTIQNCIRAFGESNLFDVEPTRGGRSKTHRFHVRKIEQTVQELHRLMPQYPANVAPFRRKNPAGDAPFVGETQQEVHPIKTETPQNLHVNPAGAAPEAFLEAIKKKEGSREGSLGKAAAAVAASLAGILPAAAHPIQTEQVIEAPAECWQTSKAQMAALMNIQEARAQKMIWMTPTGAIEVSGIFKTELLETFPLVELRNGLAVACVNVKIDRGAFDALQYVRRQFGYMQQDALAKAKKPGIQPENLKPADMPQIVWDKIQRDKAAARAERAKW